jgi:amino acid adenylation domain-containing protein/thioester reductase-like protein
MSSSKFEDEKEYWQKTLQGNLIMSSFPHDNTAYQCKVKISKVSYEIPQELTSKIVSISGQSDLAVYMILLTGIEYLLYRYSGNKDILVGMPQFRDSEETMKDNVFALRILAMENQPIRAFLMQIKEMVMNAKKYNNISFTKLVEQLYIENSREETCLFGCMVALLNIHEDVKNMKAETTFSFQLTENNIRLNIKYNEGMYQERMFNRLVEHFCRFLYTLTQEPEMKLKDVDILSNNEKSQLLTEYNNTNTEYYGAQLFHQLFEEQVKMHVAKTAVVLQEKSISYQELNNRANQLARFLRKEGVQPENIVGVMLERSIEIIICIMAILKSGGAYLPLDPNYPEERTLYMMENSNMQILLTQSEYINKVPFKGKKIHVLDEALYRGDSSNLIPVNQPSDMMYLIFTSGSSGLPKGVMVEHRNVVNMVNAWRYHYHLDEFEVRLLQLASFSFDVFTGDIARALLSGGQMTICDVHTRVDLPALYMLIKNQRINIFESTPALIIPLMEYIYLNKLDISDLKILIVGSDYFSRADFDKLYQRYGNKFRIINSYGITEVTIDSSFYEKTEDSVPDTSLVPIGKPMQNTKFYILNDHMQLQPPEIYGELYIGGAGVARGYLNNPEQTKQSYIKNPFEPNTRMYKTNDLAKWNADGNVEFGGRKDNQVKIRGFRIELGDIENQLLKFDGVKDAVVVAKQTPANSKTLYAYYTSDYEIQAARLQQFLREKMPEYMVPANTVQVDKFPITPNGKVDRKALMLRKDRNNITKVYESPHNYKEEVLFKIWETALGVEQFGVLDNFFALGGDSVKAINMVVKMSVYFELSIHDIFRYQTIRDLAKNITIKKDSLKEDINKYKMKELMAKDQPISVDEAEIQLQMQQYRQRNQHYKNIDMEEKNNYDHVLLTGATGFLGCYIAYDILKHSNCRLYLLIRGDSQATAVERMKSKFKFYFGADIYEKYKDRLIILKGDLTQAYLGLKIEMYIELSHTIECLINSAAKVEHYGQLSEFEEINVYGVEQLIQFCMTGRKKDFNQISTTGICSKNIANKNVALFSEYDFSVEQEMGNYYLQTKVVSEKLLLESRNKGLNVNIYRLSNLVFDSKTGIFQENAVANAFYTILKSFIKLEMIPETGLYGRVVDFSFIDYTSRALVTLYNRKNLKNETYHIYNPYEVKREEIATLFKEAGYSLEICPKNDFYDYVRDNFEKEELSPYIENIILHYSVLEEKDETHVIIVNEKTEMILNAIGFKWIPLDIELIRKMICYCQKIGLF